MIADVGRMLRPNRTTRPCGVEGCGRRAVEQIVTHAPVLGRDFVLMRCHAHRLGAVRVQDVADGLPASCTVTVVGV